VGRTSPFWLATAMLVVVMVLVAGGLRRANP
jgi:hypothetical protein